MKIDCYFIQERNDGIIQEVLPWQLVLQTTPTAV